MNSIKLLSLVALMALIGCQMVARSEENLDELFAPVFAQEGEPATFEQTLKAVNHLWDVIQDVEIPQDEEERDILEATKQNVGQLVEICEFSKANCDHVFEKIDKIKGEINEGFINLIPYVESCRTSQKIYCKH